MSPVTVVLKIFNTPSMNELQVSSAPTEKPFSKLFRQE
jgi:hypothetical protein